MPRKTVVVNGYGRRRTKTYVLLLSQGQVDYLQTRTIFSHFPILPSPPLPKSQSTSVLDEK
ncbi:hypothetical protein WH47_04494 [Habropoda laboriosa]|uniref:Uncharacterized protein n=1 Tax=Habropoda laboriosa TaxID=597456 RepID=A0A0L7R2B0_9HYME|nr:hypothetical protein WH47_04494 [Habropoda laboriosa]